jgi:hypothetical protein
MQFMHEFFGLFGDAPAQDDEIGPQQGVVFIQNQIQFARPRVPAQSAFNLGAPGRALFGFLAGDLQMAELSVRHQPPIDKQRAADTGAERQQQNSARHGACGAVVQFGQSRGVGVVDGDHRPLQMFGRKLRQRLANPRLVEIGGGSHDAAANHTGKCQAHGVIVRNVRDHRGESAQQRFGRILRRCRRAEAFPREGSGGQINERAFNR